MPMSNNIRKLDLTEARKILSVAQAQEHDAKIKGGNFWPGSFNLKLIAEAVDKRRQFVDLESNDSTTKRFSIKYDERARAVYIKPADNGFVPCGWFEYDQLKGVLTSE